MVAVVDQEVEFSSYMLVKYLSVVYYQQQQAVAMGKVIVVGKHALENSQPCITLLYYNN